MYFLALPTEGAQKQRHRATISTPGGLLLLSRCHSPVKRAWLFGEIDGFQGAGEGQVTLSCGTQPE